ASATATVATSAISNPTPLVCRWWGSGGGAPDGLRRGALRPVWTGAGVGSVMSLTRRPLSAGFPTLSAKVGRVGRGKPTVLEKLARGSYVAVPLDEVPA